LKLPLKSNFYYPTKFIEWTLISVSAYNWTQYISPKKPCESLASETNSDVNTPRINLKLNRDENGGWQFSQPWTQNENKYKTENSLNIPLSPGAGPIKYEINPLKRQHDSYNWSPDIKPKIEPEVKSEFKPLKANPESVKTNPKVHIEYFFSMATGVVNAKSFIRVKMANIQKHNFKG